MRIKLFTDAGFLTERGMLMWNEVNAKLEHLFESNKNTNVQDLELLLAQAVNLQASQATLEAQEESKCGNLCVSISKSQE
jgi:hypothetical protein